MRKFFAIQICLLLCCSSGKYLGFYNEKTHTFRSEEYSCEIKLPGDEGWNVALKKVPEGDFFFEAYRPGKIITVLAAAETLNSDLEDYFILLKLTNKIEQLEGYKFVGKRTQKINNNPAVVFIYSATIDDQEIGKQEFTYTNALLKKGKINYRLIVYTLTEAYERKIDYINEILNGFKITE